MPFTRIWPLARGRDIRGYPWKWQHTTSNYQNFLHTRSDVRMLAPATRDALLGDIAKAIDGQGGEIDVDYETHLYIARRADRDN